MRGTRWRLINRLLGGDAALEHGSGLPRTELDLNALAESSVSAMRPLAEEAGIKLAHEFHGPLPHVTADATTVKQILFNLLANAVKFTPRGGDVRVVTGLGYDRSVFVAVQDTGVGMTAEAIAAALNAEVPDNPQPQEGGRSRHRSAAGARSRQGQWRAARDRQCAERGHGGRADLPARSRRGAREHPRRHRCFKLDDF